MATQAAYLAADHVLITVKPEYLAAIGLPLLATSLRTFSDTYERQVAVAGIVFNDVVSSYENERSKDDVIALAQANGWYVFENEVSHSDSYPRGPREQTAITRTKQARWSRRLEFERVSQEFLRRVGLLT